MCSRIWTGGVSFDCNGIPEQYHFRRHYGNRYRCLTFLDITAQKMNHLTDFCRNLFQEAHLSLIFFQKVISALRDLDEGNRTREVCFNWKGIPDQYLVCGHHGNHSWRPTLPVIIAQRQNWLTDFGCNLLQTTCPSFLICSQKAISALKDLDVNNWTGVGQLRIHPSAISHLWTPRQSFVMPILWGWLHKDKSVNWLLSPSIAGNTSFSHLLPISNKCA